jgi:hypothetical protein
MYLPLSTEWKEGIRGMEGMLLHIYFIENQRIGYDKVQVEVG